MTLEESLERANAMWAEQTRSLPEFITAKPGVHGLCGSVTFGLHHAVDHDDGIFDVNIEFWFQEGSYWGSDGSGTGKVRMEDVTAVGREMERFILWFEQGCRLAQARFGLQDCFIGPRTDQGFSDDIKFTIP